MRAKTFYTHNKHIHVHTDNTHTYVHIARAHKQAHTIVMNVVSMYAYIFLIYVSGF